MSKRNYNSLKIVINQIDEYLEEKKDLGAVVSSLELFIDQIPGEKLKVMLDKEWAKLEIIHAVSLDQNGELNEHNSKEIYGILRNFKNTLLQEADKNYVLPESNLISKDQFLKECGKLIEKIKLQNMNLCDFVEILAELITKNKDQYNGRENIINGWSKLYNSSLDNGKRFLTSDEIDEFEKIIEDVL